MKRFSYGSLWISLGLLLCILGGCISKHQTLLLKYSAENDSYTVLILSTHYQASHKDDLKWLAEQYALRDRLIPYGPLIFSFMTEPAAVRKSNDSFDEIDLSKKAKFIERKTKIPLEDIHIKPGEFYRGPEGGLAYYHELEIPGRTVDLLLQETPVDDVAKTAEAEQQRRKTGGKRKDWAELHEKLELALKEEKVNPNVDNDPVQCLSDATLSLLAEKKDIRVSRDKRTFSLTLPMELEDSKQFVKFWMLFKQVVAKEMTKREQLAPSIDLLDAIAVKSTGDGLALSLEVPEKFDGRKTFPPRKYRESELGEIAETLAAIEKQGIRVRNDFDADKHADEFLLK